MLSLSVVRSNAIERKNPEEWENKSDISLNCMKWWEKVLRDKNCLTSLKSLEK